MAAILLFYGTKKPPLYQCSKLNCFNNLLTAVLLAFGYHNAIDLQ